MKLDSTADEIPVDKEALGRLADLLKECAGERAEFTLNRLCDLLEPQSRESLAVLLGEFVRRGWLKLIVRVESPGHGGGIGDFDSLEVVPDFLYDWRTDREIEVNTEDLQVVYATA